MPIAFSSLTEEDLNVLERGDEQGILYKSDEIEFTYNKLSLGKGKLYILEKKVIWVANSEEKKKKEKITDFKNYSTNSIYLKHYEQNKNIYLKLLNDVDNICIDSVDIALHAITADRKVCNKSCVYIQLNSNLGLNNKINFPKKDLEISNKKEDLKNGDTKNKQECIINSMKGQDSDNDDGDDGDWDEHFDEDEEDLITPEILLTSSQPSVNEIIFRQLSKMDCADDDVIETDGSREEEEKGGEKGE
ncbi:conserved protein, unknown function [Hepatocystis sp. ex Piliocolobus tephrosceles]|nr:conserved protein, unknown function [Hepatocystis sp. ex Piliocolobus tephrosceles]